MPLLAFMSICMLVHTYACAYTHACTHICCTYADIHACTYAHIHIHAHTHAYTNTHMLAHTYACTPHTHSCTHTCTLVNREISFLKEEYYLEEGEESAWLLFWNKSQPDCQFFITQDLV